MLVRWYQNLNKALDKSKLSRKALSNEGLKRPFWPIHNDWALEISKRCCTESLESVLQCMVSKMCHSLMSKNRIRSSYTHIWTLIKDVKERCTRHLRQSQCCRRVKYVTPDKWKDSTSQASKEKSVTVGAAYCISSWSVASIDGL